MLFLSRFSQPSVRIIQGRFSLWFHAPNSIGVCCLIIQRHFKDYQWETGYALRSDQHCALKADTSRLFTIRYLYPYIPAVMIQIPIVLAVPNKSYRSFLYKMVNGITSLSIILTLLSILISQSLFSIIFRIGHILFLVINWELNLIFM